MKKILPAILIILSTANAWCQDYTIKPSSAWKIDKLTNVISQRGQRNTGDENYRLFINGDTVIQSKNYYKLYKTGILYLDKPMEYESLYMGALRQEASEVFFVNPQADIEELLYNFDVRINDTITAKIGKGKKVLDIDTLEDGRRKYYISKSAVHAMEAFIIEGVGSSGGLLNEPPIGHYMVEDNYLVCYTETDNIVTEGFDPLDCGCLTKPSRFPIDPRATWRVQYVPTKNSDFPGIEGQKYYSYIIDGDTLIKNQKYFKLYRSGVFYLDEPFYFEHVYSGALRDDDNKFFFVDNQETEEVLLIDYNVEVGDTIKAQIGNGSEVKHITILQDGRKYVDTSGDIAVGCAKLAMLIEGIGHTGGIMETPPCEHPGYMVNRLSCYMVDDSMIYLNPLAKDSACGTATIVPDKNLTGLKIYPVPVSKILTIEHYENLSSFKSISITDIEGRIVFRENIKTQSNSFQIDLEQLRKGFYLVNVIHKTLGQVNYKILKQ